jgi:hypothetical protein
LFGGERGLSNTPYWNSGVFAFRSNEATTTLFEDWRTLFEKMALGVDQPGLAESLISSKVRFAGVDRQWNWSAQQWRLRRIPGWPIRILHYMYLIDSRIADWQIAFADTVADNGSSARALFGRDRVPIDGLDLDAVCATLLHNGEVVGEATGEAVLGHPAEAVAWLANALGSFGRTLRAGEYVMSGSFMAAVRAEAGDRFEARFDGLGDVSCRFV